MRSARWNSWFDPQVEFLEVGVMVNGAYLAMKTYGPDANGVYGGLQGRGWAGGD